jgi:hypothetical protein
MDMTFNAFWYLLIFLVFFFLVLDFELRALHLPGKCSTNQATLPAILVAFE